MRAAILVLIVSVAVPAYLVTSRKGDAAEHESSTEPTSPGRPAANLTLKGSPITWPHAKESSQLVYVSPSFRQEIIYGKAYDENEPQNLLLMNYDDPKALLPDESFEFGASFDIVKVRAKTKDHFYVYGLTVSGEEVIERWKRVNVAMPGGGGSYVMRRKEVFRGTGLNGIMEFDVDPQARYLLLIHDAPFVVSQMALPSGQPLSAVYDASQIPALLTLVSPLGLFPRLHPAEGLVWTLEGFDSIDPGRRTLFYDYDDDGVIDDWNTFDSSQYFAAYDPTVWLDDYVFDF